MTYVTEDLQDVSGTFYVCKIGYLRIQSQDCFLSTVRVFFPINLLLNNCFNRILFVFPLTSIDIEHRWSNNGESELSNTPPLPTTFSLPRPLRNSTVCRTADLFHQLPTEIGFRFVVLPSVSVFIGLGLKETD